MCEHKNTKTLSSDGNLIKKLCLDCGLKITEVKHKKKGWLDAIRSIKLFK